MIFNFLSQQENVFLSFVIQNIFSSLPSSLSFDEVNTNMQSWSQLYFLLEINFVCPCLNKSIMSSILWSSGLLLPSLSSSIDVFNLIFLSSWLWKYHNKTILIMSTDTSLLEIDSGSGDNREHDAIASLFPLPSIGVDSSWPCSVHYGYHVLCLSPRHVLLLLDSQFLRKVNVTTNNYQWLEVSSISPIHSFFTCWLRPTTVGTREDKRILMLITSTMNHITTFCELLNLVLLDQKNLEWTSFIQGFWHKSWILLQQPQQHEGNWPTE